MPNEPLDDDDDDLEACIVCGLEFPSSELNDFVCLECEDEEDF